MKKRTLIIISLLSAFLSLIYILLSYFGLVRYFSIYWTSIEKYSKNYSKLDVIDEDKRVIISLILDPKHQKNIDKTIKSLLDQTIRVDLISLTLHEKDDYKVPEKLKDVLQVLWTKKDYGILNSIIPYLIREGESSTQIIILESGYIYGKDYIENLLTEAQKFPNKVIYVGTKDKKRGTMNINKGMVVTTEKFNEEFIQEAHKNKEVPSLLNNFISPENRKKIKYNQNYKII